MKKFILVSLLLSGSLFGAVEYDLQKGIDLTALTSVTASQLNQLVDKGTVGTNKGMIYYGPSYPDVTLNPRYARFIWLDSSTIPAVPKTYAGSNNIWVATSVGDGAITTAKLADSAVTEIKLAANSVSSGKIQANAIVNAAIADGSVTSNKVAALNIGTAHIQSQAIVAAKIADATITGTQIAAAVITNDKIATSGVVNSNLAVNAVTGDKIALNAITSTNIATGGVALTNLSTSGATINQVVGYNGTSVTYVTPVISTNYYVETSVPAANTHATLAHLYGAVPILYSVVLRCDNTGENGYSVGDEVPFYSLKSDAAAESEGKSIAADASNFTILMPNGYGNVRLYNKTNATAAFTITSSRWKVRFYIFK